MDDAGAKSFKEWLKNPVNVEGNSIKFPLDYYIGSDDCIAYADIASLTKDYHIHRILPEQAGAIVSAFFSDSFGDMGPALDY